MNLLRTLHSNVEKVVWTIQDRNQNKKNRTGSVEETRPKGWRGASQLRRGRRYRWDRKAREHETMMNGTERRAKLDTYCLLSYTDSGLADRAATIQLFVQAGLSPYFSMGLRRASPSKKEEKRCSSSFVSIVASCLIKKEVLVDDHPSETKFRISFLLHLQQKRIGSLGLGLRVRSEAAA